MITFDPILGALRKKDFGPGSVQSIYQYVVPTVAALAAVPDPVTGEIAVVVDNGDGTGALYQYNGSAWVLLCSVALAGTLTWDSGANSWEIKNNLYITNADGTTKTFQVNQSQVGFFAVSPVSQQSGNISTALANYGLVTAGTLPAGSVTGLGGAAVLNVGTAAGTVAAGDHGHAQLHTQNTDAGTTATTFTVDSDAILGKIAVTVAAGAANKTLTLTNAVLTGDQTITFPDNTGTVALTSQLHTQNTDTGTTSSEFTVDSDAILGKIKISAAAGAADKTLTLTNAVLTDNRTITFPDSAGTVALTSQLHTQNTDTGTTSASFQLLSGSSGPTLYGFAGPNLNPFSNVAAGTSATNTLVIPSGTAPSTSPADAVQVYAGDLEAVAGKGALYIRGEDGNVLGMSGTRIVFPLSNVIGVGDSSYGANFPGTSITPSTMYGFGHRNNDFKSNYNGLWFHAGNGGSSPLAVLWGGAYRAPDHEVGPLLIIGTSNTITGKNGGSILIYAGNHTSGSTTEGSVTITNADGTTPIMSFNESRIGIGTAATNVGTNGTNTIVMASGVAPTTSPADAVQVYAGDVTVGGKAGLFVRGEGGGILKTDGKNFSVNATASNTSGSVAFLSGTASGATSFAAGYTTSSGDYSFSAGKTSIASGYASAVIGNSCAASGTTSVAIGESSASTLYGQFSVAGGKFAANGDAQLSNLNWRNSTADATTPVELFLDGTDDRAILTAERTWAGTLIITARQDAGVSCVWTYRNVIIERTANTTRLISGGSDLLISGDTTLDDSVIAIAADDTNDALTITVTSESATATRWTAVYSFNQIGF